MGRALAAVVLAGGMVTALGWNSPVGRGLRYRMTSLVSLGEITARDPRDRLAWRELGLRLARDGDGTLAEPALRSALALDNSDPEVATALGEILTARGDRNEALQVLRGAISHQSDYPLARMALGRLYRHRGAYHLAAEQFRAVAAGHRDFPDASYELAVCYLQMQQVQNARSAIDHALLQSPRQPEYLALRGAVLAAVGQVDDAIACLRSAAGNAPGDVRIQANLASLLLAHERGPADLALAEQTCRDIERLDPHYRLLPYLHGRLAMARQDWGAAARFLQEAAATTPGQDEIHYALSQVYRRLGRSDEAERETRIYRERQETMRRIDELRIALTTSRHPADLYERLADLQLKADDPGAAAVSLEQSLQGHPDRPDLRKRLAAVRARLASQAPER